MTNPHWEGSFLSLSPFCVCVSLSLMSSCVPWQLQKMKEKKPQLNSKIINNPIFKMGKRSEETFLQRRHTSGQRVYEKVLNITNQGSANQNLNEISPCLKVCWIRAQFPNKDHSMRELPLVAGRNTFIDPEPTETPFQDGYYKNDKR